MDRPILFSTPMIRALLGGFKSQTRRVLKIEADSIEAHEELPGEFAPWKDGERLSTITCPYGAPGDQLYVREGFRIEQRGDRLTGKKFDVYVYRADSRMRPEFDPLRYKPSIHMPRAASRITLTITETRVERLQDIKSADAAAEGWPGADDDHINPVSWYADLWDQINGKRHPWVSNPWVWALTFTVGINGDRS